MIFTIGYTESYERYFIEQKQPRKLGRTNDYVGGSVWRTFEEAKLNCPDSYSVYGVLANWETETEPSKDGNWNDLLITSDLVQLDKS